MPVSDRTITSLAILKVNMDERRDHIENFVPFLAESLRTCDSDIIALPAVQASIQESFGIRIPQGALKTILARASKHGIVTRKNNIYYCNRQVIDQLDFTKTRERAMREHAALTDKLIKFCQARHGVIWSDAEADAALLSYVSRRSLPILASAIDGEPIVAPDQAVENAQFLVPAFAAELYQRDPEGFAYLETVVKGSMIADALLYPDLNRISEAFKQVDVYVDTEFLLRALGFEGEELQAPSLELLSMLRLEKAELRCFQHTVDELRGILVRASRVLRDGQQVRSTNSGVLEYCLRKRKSASDVDLDIARLERLISGLGIMIKPTPDYTIPLGVDESKFAEMLRRGGRYQHDDALQHDIRAITAIHRLRKGRVPIRLEDCHAIFVTTNDWLARVSTEFFRSELPRQSDSVHHCFPYHVLTTLVWLKQPLKAPDLPRKRIIADCYAALNPDDELWKLYLAEIAKLRERSDLTEEDYLLLRFSPEARVALMDVTLGEGDAFSEGTIDSVLERARAHARAKTESELASTKSELDRERKLRVAADEEVTKQRIARQQARTDLENLLRARSVTASKWFARALQFTAGILLGLLVYSTLPSPLIDLPKWSTDWIPSMLLTVSLVLYAVLSWKSLVSGTTMQALVERWERFMARWIERLLFKLTMPSQRDDEQPI